MIQKYSWEASHASEGRRQNKREKGKLKVIDKELKGDSWCEKETRTKK